MTTIDPQLTRAREGGDSSRLPVRGIAQITAVAWVYILYAGLRNFATGPTVVALRNAEKILGAERFLHLDIERSVQRLALDNVWLVKLCSFCYSATHLVVPVAVLVLLYRRTPARYLVWRDTFLVLLGMALLGFALFPTTPPWLMPMHYGYVDTAQLLTRHHEPVGMVLGAHVGPTAGDLWSVSNPFAAMPSLHVTWAIWATCAAWPVVRRRWVRVALAAYPPAMLLSVLATGNHWTLDAIVGAVLLAASYGVARAIDRLRATRVAWFRSPETATGLDLG
jgi:hypothetical protein